MTESVRRVNGSLATWVLSLDDGTVEMHLAGEFGLEPAAAVERQLGSVLATHAQLLVDLSALTFIDASAVGVLARAKHACDGRDATLTLRLGSSPARRVLDVVGLSAFLHVVD